MTKTRKKQLPILLALFLAGAITPVIYSETVCDKCNSAHEDTSHDGDQTHGHSGDCAGVYWSTAIPGKCNGEGEPSGDNECFTDGTTVVTIHKMGCQDRIGDFTSTCDHFEVLYPNNEDENVTVGDCYHAVP